MLDVEIRGRGRDRQQPPPLTCGSFETGSPTDCVIEADLPAHPYQVMGVATEKRWQVALTLDQAVAIPVD